MRIVEFFRRLFKKNELLLNAAEDGNLGKIKSLIESKADVNAKGPDGVMALWIAAQKGFTEIVKALIENKADVNAKGHDGVTALMIASQEGFTEIVKALIENKADVNAKGPKKTTALFMAAQNGHLEIVKVLLEAGADVNIQRKTDGITALCVAAQKGHSTIVKALLDNKADVNAKGHDGVTALMIAVQMGLSTVCEALIDAKADVNAIVNIEGKNYTPLDIANQFNEPMVIKLLKKAGAEYTINSKAKSKANLGPASMMNCSKCGNYFEKSKLTEITIQDAWTGQRKDVKLCDECLSKL